MNWMTFWVFFVVCFDVRKGVRFDVVVFGYISFSSSGVVSAPISGIGLVRALVCFSGFDCAILFAIPVAADHKAGSP